MRDKEKISNGVDTENLKRKLLEEKEKLGRDLASIGHKNPDNPKDWVPDPDKLDILESDRNEAADRLESYGENAAIVNELEVRYNNVLRALKKMEEGKYGLCEIGHTPIEPDRLEANPAARTCKAHINEEANLPK